MTLASISFMIGVVVWIGRIFGMRQIDNTTPDTAADTTPPADPDVDALVPLALWAVTMLAPSVLSEAAPLSCTFSLLPAALLPIGLGLTWIVTRAWPRRLIGPALAGAIVVASTLITVYDYFVRFPQVREVYYVYEVDKADALAILKERGSEQIVYFSPLWAEHPPVRYFRGGSNIKTLNTADTLVLPPTGIGAAYAFTPEDCDRAELAALWPDANIEHFVDRYDGPPPGSRWSKLKPSLLAIGRRAMPHKRRSRRAFMTTFPRCWECRPAQPVRSISGVRIGQHLFRDLTTFRPLDRR